MLESERDENRRDVDLLQHVARAAGEVALTFFTRDPRVWWKNGVYGTSPVSQADFAVDTLLRNMLREARPDYGWLSEETPDDLARLAARRVFVVDPIDGTRAFLAHGEDWAISLAVVEGGKPRAAVLYQPARGALMHAVLGLGAWNEGERMRASVRTTLAGARLRGPPSLLPEALLEKHRIERVPSARSLALRLAGVAQGVCDAAIARPSCHEWDIAAADLLVCEAGGAIQDAARQPIRYNQPSTRQPALVAAPRALLAPMGDFLQVALETRAGTSSKDTTQV